MSKLLVSVFFCYRHKTSDIIKIELFLDVWSDQVNDSEIL